MIYDIIIAFSLAFLQHISSVAFAAPTNSSTNLGTVVNLRIEGANRTIFEDFIFTRGHRVTSASGVTLDCDGTNNHTNPFPGPTCTSALEDASKLKHFTWDGTFFADFDDFLITRIARSEQTATEFWGLLLNFQFAPVGGCQQQVKLGDKVLWAFDAFDKTHFLSLAGPVTAGVGKPATFTVTDGSSGDAVANATVRSTGGGEPVAVTDRDGRVQLTFHTAGVHSLKADRADSLRSNKVDVIVS
ncbi:hypothetical protein EIP86_001624 [Pleurotus ostreatoroseus]|nr:hypothetical protein EIP86_001624 [Pleurotus ostreatoroseus]